MKRFLIFIFALSLLYSCAPVQVAPTVSLEKDILNSKNWNVAVLDLNYEFEGEGQISGGTYKSAGKDGGSIVAGILAAELANIEQLQMVERDRLNDLLDEQALQHSGMIDSQSALEIGRIAGANAVVFGDLTDYVSWQNIAGYGSTISFSIRMIDVETGRIILNGAISRVRSYVEPFSNVQLTTKEFVDAIKKY